MIHLEHVSKVYPIGRGEVRALDDVSLQVDRGQFVAVRGHSGSGKSTLLSLVGGLDTATSGTVRVDGKDLAQMTASERARFRAESIGFVFQLFHLLPYLTVVDNVLVAALPDRRATAPQRAKEMLDRFGLGDRLAHRPAQLSIGERQRVAIARALLNEPELLLADEPTGNLDAESAAAVLDLLSAFHREGGTVLLVTHEETAASIAERTVSLRSGRIETRAAAAETA